MLHLRVAFLMAVFSVACADPTTPPTAGQVVWRVPSGPPTDQGQLPLSPVANKDRSMVYLATDDNRLRKIRGSDGHVEWDVSAGAIAPVVPQMNAVLSATVVALAKVDIVAFDTATGAPRWLYKPSDLEETGDDPLAANDSTIFAAGLKGRVHAVNAKTGTARWITDISEGKPHVGAFNPTIGANVIYACTRDFNAAPATGALWALDMTTGAVIWSYHFAPAVSGEGSSCWGSAALWHDLVIQPQEDGRVFAFDRQTGAVRWIAPMVHDPSMSLGDRRWAAVGGDVVLVTSQALAGMIVGYDAATGTERWRRTEWGGSIFVPVLDSTVAYVDHGWVYASYDLATGATRWQTPPSLSDPATLYKAEAIIAGDRVYVAARDGAYALRR